MALDVRRYCKKNQLFYHRSRLLEFVNKKGEFEFYKTCLMIGDLYKMNGYIRRHLQIKTQNEFFEHITKVFNSKGYGFEGDILMRKHKEEIKFLMSLYD